MSNASLVILILVLGGCVALVATNPTSQAYAAFLEAKLGEAIERMDPTMPTRERAFLRELYASQGKRLIELVVQRHTERRDFGLFSVFESRMLERKIVVVGIATTFVPIEGVEEGASKLGQLAPMLRQ